MTSMIQHIKDKKIYYIAGIGIAISVATCVWLGVRKNAYEIQLDGQVIGVVKTKEEATACLQSSIEALETKLGKDIAVYEEVTAVPVHSKKSALSSAEALEKAFNETMTYGMEAIEIVIDGKTMAVVENREISEHIFEEIGLRQLPQGSTLQLVEGEQPKAEVAQEKVDEVNTEEEQPTLQGKEAEQPVEDGTSIEGTEPIEGPELIEATDSVEESAEASTEVNEELSEYALIIEGAKAQEEEAVELHIGEVKKAEMLTRDGKPVSTVKREYKAFDFNQKVQVRKAYVDEADVMTEEEALDVLLSNTDEVIKYVMKPGDNVWDVALAHGTTMDRILEINPQITDVTRMQIGEEIKVAAPDPVLSVATTEVAIFKEIIPAEIEYVEDNTLYKGEEKVKQAGNDGVKELTVSVDKVNGREVSRTHLNEKILREPVKKIIGYGTKEKPKNPTGSTVTPAKKGMFMHPLNGGGRISSEYGSRWGSYHRGMDIAASAGTPIYAAASGTVIYSGYNNGGFGNLVMIDHGNGYQTYYAHNSKNVAQVGQKVSKGQKIAVVGSTGNSTGNHVHFEIRKNGTPINPYSYIY